MNVRGVLAALAAAALFGGSAPAAKLLVAGASPVLVAGLLYLGSGLGLAVVEVVRSVRRAPRAPLPAGGRGPFVLAVAAGGVVAPALWMAGLARTPAGTASLLLNLEGVFTALLAWLVVREHTSRRVVAGFACVAVGGLVLGYDAAAPVGLSWGAVLILGACLAWAADNNLTRAVSSADPVRLALLKGIAAGVVNCTLAVGVLHAAVPAPRVVAALLVTGFLGYGLSLVLFIVGLRHLGTARNGAYFALAPFVGVAASWLLLEERLNAQLLVAAALMLLGLVLHLTEEHSHEHVHEELVHTHEHEHDDHHQHDHPPGIDPRAPHVHEHRHPWLIHTHAHTPDLHHRHAHEPSA